MPLSAPLQNLGVVFISDKGSGVMTWQKQLSQYLIFFSFSFILFLYRWMREIKVTHKEVRDFSVGLGSEVCISSVENPMGTLSSSLCQTLNKGTVGLIPVIGL